MAKTRVITAMDAINAMKFEKATGKSSDIVVAYLNRMFMYSAYCWEDKADDWNGTMQRFLASAGDISDELLMEFLQQYEIVGKIMAGLADGLSWVKIKRMAYKNSYFLPSIAEEMLRFSPHGTDFVDIVVSPVILLDNPYLSEMYEEIASTSAVSGGICKK